VDVEPEKKAQAAGLRGGAVGATCESVDGGAQGDHGWRLRAGPFRTASSNRPRIGAGRTRATNRETDQLARDVFQTSR
jgi:hypothetical protein